MDDLENRSRRSNIIIYGVAENEKESDDSLEEVVNETIVKNILKMEPITCERIHRLGKPAAKKNTTDNLETCRLSRQN